MTGLLSSTTYHARLVATSAGGTTNGPDLVFTTGDVAPSVTGHVGGLGHDERRHRVRQRQPEPRGDDLQGGVRATASYGSATTAGVRRLGLERRRGERPADRASSRPRPTTRAWSRRAPGGTTNGPDLVFTTGDVPPSVANTSVGTVTTGGATVSGDVNPNRVATTYKVEYGTTILYGSQTAPVSAGSGSAAVAASVPLTGLLSSTTLPRAAGRDERRRDDERSGPRLHDGRHRRRRSSGTSVGSVTTSGATVVGQREPQPRRDELQRRVRHDGGVRVGDDARVRRARAPARSRRASR